MSRSSKPVTITAAFSLLTCGLLAVALWRGWLGPDVGRGANFCEAARDWFVKQPANTFSNAGFVIAGLLVAWRINAAPGLPSGSAMRSDLATAMACLMVLLGPASAAMHATQSAIGGHIDMLSMYLFASFILGFAVARWRRGGAGLFAATFLVGLTFCELVGLYRGHVPVVGFAGNLAFGALILATTALEVAIIRRGETLSRRGFIYAAVAALLLAFAIWNAAQHGLCDPHSLLQGHAIWHLLCALSAYLVYRYYESETFVEADPGAQTSPTGANLAGRR